MLLLHFTHDLPKKEINHKYYKITIPYTYNNPSLNNLSEFFSTVIKYTSTCDMKSKDIDLLESAVKNFAKNFAYIKCSDKNFLKNLLAKIEAVAFKDDNIKNIAYQFISKYRTTTFSFIVKFFTSFKYSYDINSENQWSTIIHKIYTEKNVLCNIQNQTFEIYEDVYECPLKYIHTYDKSKVTNMNESNFDNKSSTIPSVIKQCTICNNFIEENTTLY